MKVAILGGTGRMGKGLARGYLKAGHEVILGSRDAARAKAEAAAIASEVPNAQASGGELKMAAWEGEVVILSIPFREAANVVRELPHALGGKIIVDLTNPFGAVPVGQTSGIEHNAEALGVPARWVAAYKTNFWKTLDQPTDKNGVRRDVLICGDDEDAKRTVSELIESTGFRAVDCGALPNARTLDPMVPLMIELDRRYQRDASSSWKFLD